MDKVKQTLKWVKNVVSNRNMTVLNINIMLMNFFMIIPCSK